MGSEKGERPSRRNQGPETKLSPAVISELRKKLAELG
jgi:hypothetical protein